MSAFKLISPFEPQGDQPEAIRQLTESIRDGNEHQVLLGVTGSGKTFTVAKVIEAVNRPTLVLADAADRSVFEFFPHLLELAADGSTSGGGLDDEGALVVGVAGTPHEPAVNE